ncbi:uncharacterized protein LOC105691247 isoform X1 [Athalia rosae]|uniref:uncharacterized protein LOC105691247 isoform X1 n=1 Tax=Athalia rosae TaxID=37344 RepID=UPI0006252326|nr:uncharacterized protein LOC105691247 isoform X1 [Athalia rosae]
MKDTLSFVLVLLIATTSLNRGEKIKLPNNNKRYVGFLNVPRNGRSPGMTGYARTDRASGLMPFPRIGRSDPSDYDVVLDLNYDDMSHEVKRQGLIPFPRVGRSRDVSSSPYGNELVKVAKVKRTGDAVPNGGMWFGPRLGRLHRRADDPQPDDQQWAVFPLREFPAPGPQADNFTPRLGRESDGDETQSTPNTGGY